MDVVMIPIYSKEACLSITLELIGKTAEHQNFYYLFVADHGFRSSVIPVATNWLRTHKGEIYKVGREQAQSPIKQSYALYKGYQKALQLTDDLVFLIEDDIFVSNRFFEWHYKILDKLPDVKLSIGTKQRDVPYPIPEDFENYIVKPDYQSLGVCWRKNSLAEVLKIFTPAYWQAPFRYTRNLYPHVPMVVASQDGLIHKHIIAKNWQVVFPVMPVAFHGGFFGANRGVKRVTGTLEQKIAKIKSIAFNEATLKAELRRNNRPDEPYFYDSIPIDLVQTPVEIRGKVSY